MRLPFVKLSDGRLINLNQAKIVHIRRTQTESMKFAEVTIQWCGDLDEGDWTHIHGADAEKVAAILESMTNDTVSTPVSMIEAIRRLGFPRVKAKQADGEAWAAEVKQ